MAISSGGVLRYDTARLASAASTLKDRIKAAETSYDNVMTIVRNTSRYWIGEAGNEHRRAFLEERDDIDEILVRLKEYPDDLLKIAGLMEETETKTNDIVSQPSTQRGSRGRILNRGASDGRRYQRPDRRILCKISGCSSSGKNAVRQHILRIRIRGGSIESQKGKRKTEKKSRIKEAAARTEKRPAPTSTSISQV